jgi:DMSO/TMAO reductase YedYZ molybdopterin-dependent catalytic subunit
MEPEVSVGLDELQLAARNHGLPLEALAFSVTPLGLHYVLTHFDVPVIDAASWRLEVGGALQRPASLGLADIRAMPAVTAAVTMECAGNGRALVRPHIISQPWLHEAVGTMEWTGVPVAALLDAAGVRAEAREVVFTGLDAGIDGGVEQVYARSLSLADARSDGVMLAYAGNGVPLLPQHGYPLRLVVPGWYGMTSVKWLGSVRVVSEPFEGYQQATAYRMRSSADEPGTPVTRMAPRALMVPPGIPDFMTRERFVDGAEVAVQGRAWSGRGAIDAVEFSSDGGTSWHPAELAAPIGRHAWRGWSYTWRPDRTGRHELCCAARDDAGNRQPLTPPWNLGGYSNNAVQRVAVTVRPPAQ